MGESIRGTSKFSDYIIFMKHFVSNKSAASLKCLPAIRGDVLADAKANEGVVHREIIKAFVKNANRWPSTFPRNSASGLLSLRILLLN